MRNVGSVNKVFNMQKSETVKKFKLQLMPQELEFLKMLLEEEQMRLVAERGFLMKKLRETEKRILNDLCEDANVNEEELLTTESDELILRAVLKEPEKSIHELRRTLRANIYLREARLGVVNGFIEHFTKFLDGTLRHGGRLNFIFIHGRESLKFGDAFWFKRTGKLLL